MYALGEIGTEVAIRGLLKALENPEWKVRLSAPSALGKIKNDGSQQGRCHPAAYILPNLLALILTDSGKEAFDALTAIQANCKFYNFTFRNARLARQNEETVQPQVTQNFYAPVTGVAGMIQGKQIVQPLPSEES